MGVPPEDDAEAKLAKPEKHIPEDTYEVTILPQETDEEEGELFLSERWKSKIDTSEQQEPIEEGTDETPPVVSSASTSPAGTTPQSNRPLASAARPSVGSTAHPVSHATTSTGPKPGASGGGGNRFVPPVAFNQAPSENEPIAATVPVPAVANRAPDYRRSSERRNLVAGILLGGVIEHVRHKRREKRTQAAHKKEVKKLKEAQQFQTAEHLQERQKAARVQTTLEKQIERLKQALPAKKTPETPGKTKKSQETLEQAPQKKAEAPQSAPAPRVERQPVSTFYEEFKQKYRTPEVSRAATKEIVSEKPRPTTPEKPAPVPAQQPEQADEPLEIPKDRRVETSAWHRIEVDKKTGKAVEDPTVAYGEEFQNEQHQEQLRRQIDEASMETETVKQNYMPMVDKTASTRVEVHDPTPLPKAANHKQPSSAASLTNKLQDIRDKAGDTNSVDIVLWIVLFLVIAAIIALL